MAKGKLKTRILSVSKVSEAGDGASSVGGTILEQNRLDGKTTFGISAPLQKLFMKH